MKNILAITALLMIGLVLSMNVSTAGIYGDVVTNAETAANTNTAGITGSATANANTETSTGASASSNAGASRTGIKSNAVADVKVRERAVAFSEVDDEFESESDFDAESVQEANAEIDASVKKEAKQSTFAQVSIGQGWAIRSDTDPDEGSFVRLFWVEKTFVDSDTGANETTKARGFLRIGSDTYKLMLNSETSNSMTFDVMSKDKKQGTLELNMQNSLMGFTSWTGDLKLDSGQTYEVEAATRNSKIKGTEAKADVESKTEVESESDVDAEAGRENRAGAETGSKVGLWARIRALFG